MSPKKLRFLEFLLVGLIMGTGEDLLAVIFATGEPFTWKILGIVFLVALPFAYISEYIVDHPKFWGRIFKKIEKEN
ncbi:MAG: hypothetical protein Q8O49_00775 [bacterium]|nr:hypothetical protein [bacterium]